MKPPRQTEPPLLWRGISCPHGVVDSLGCQQPRAWPLRPEAKYWAKLPGTSQRLTSGTVSTVVHERPWLVVVEVTHLDTHPRARLAPQLHAAAIVAAGEHASVPMITRLAKQAVL